jgi:hypothetical protein
MRPDLASLVCREPDLTIIAIAVFEKEAGRLKLVLAAV